MTKSLEEVAIAVKKKKKKNDDDDQCHCVPIHNKLPDDVLHLILMKLSDPKSLLCCFLVSKQFSSILSEFQSLSIRLPSCSLAYPFKPDPKFNAVLLHWKKLISDRFTEIRSLCIELPCACPTLPPCTINNYPFIWDFKVAHNLRTLAFISKASIRKIEDKEEDPRKTDGNSHGEKICSMGNANLVYLMLQHLVSQKHPNIESVEIMNPKEHGNVSLQGEQLIALKKSLSRIKYFCVLYAPKLRLPRLGLVMERVTLGVGGVNDFPWKDIRELATDLGDEIFGEALSQILRDFTFISIQYFD